VDGQSREKEDAIAGRVSRSQTKGRGTSQISLEMPVKKAKVCEPQNDGGERERDEGATQVNKDLLTKKEETEG